MSDGANYYRRTLRLAGQIPWVASPDFQLRLPSEHWIADWAALTGTTPSSGLAIDIAAAIHPEDRERAASFARIAMARPAEADGRFRIVHLDGTARWTRIRFAPDYDAAGAVRQWYGTIEDIDKRVESEQAAIETEAAYRYTLDLQGQIPWTAPADCSVFSIHEPWVERWYELTGRKTDLVLATYVPDLLHPDDLPRILADTRERIAAGLRIDQRYRLRSLDGTYRWWRSRAVPRLDEQGAIVRWYGTIEDVDDDVAEEERRKERDAIYRLTIEVSGMIPWFMPAGGWTISIGPDDGDRWRALTGREPSSTIGDYISRAIHPDDLKRTAITRGEAIAAGQPLDHRYRLLMADGSYRWWRSRASPLRDKNGDVIHWYGTLEDIHEQVQNEERLQHLEFELAHFGRLAAMNSLASTLAHELGQPLAAVANYVHGAARLLKESRPDLPQIEAALDAAAVATMRSGDIVRSMRSMVARGSVSRDHENVAHILERASVLAMADVGANAIDYQTEVDPDVHTVYVDRVQIEQVLINLLRNSVDAVAGRPIRTIRARAQLDGDEVRISVTDSGPGVAPEFLDNLFGAFHSTKPDGLGVGLSISRTIVEANGGRISYSQVPEGGACFAISVPVSQ